MPISARKMFYASCSETIPFLPVLPMPSAIMRKNNDFSGASHCCAWARNLSQPQTRKVRMLTMMYYALNNPSWTGKNRKDMILLLNHILPRIAQYVRTQIPVFRGRAFRLATVLHILQRELVLPTRQRVPSGQPRQSGIPFQICARQ